MIADLKPYPAMKDSGVPWLGEVPEHWEVQRGRQLFEIRKRIANRLGLPIISVTQTGLVVRDIETFTGQMSQDYTKYQIVREGEFAMNSMDLLTGGVGLASTMGVTSPDYRVFTVRDAFQCDSNFMLSVLRLLYQNRGFYAWGQGSAQLGRWRLPRKRFNDFPFPLPPPDEQWAIVRFLDYADRRIRRYIAAKQKLIKLLEEQIVVRAAAAMNHPARGSERLGNIVTQRLDEVARDESTYYTALGLYNRGRGIFHKAPRSGSDLGDSDFYWVECGDLVISGQFAWEGAVAMAAAADDTKIVSHRYYLLRGFNGRATTAYLWALLRSDLGAMLLDQHSRGAAGRNRPLNLRTLLKERVPVPPIDEQKAVDELVEAIAPIRARIQAEITLLREYRTRLIADVVTGKLDVREAAAALPPEPDTPNPLDDPDPELLPDDSDESLGDAPELEEVEA